MAYPGPSVGPWQSALTGDYTQDMVIINEVFRQIEEQINLIRGLRNEALITSGVTLTLAVHDHESTAGGGKISHDDALDDVSANDHHNKSHVHSGDGSGTVDHGVLSGLSDDDHSQYLLASDAGSRAIFAANWTDLTDSGDTTLHTHSGGSSDGDTRDVEGSESAMILGDELIAGENIELTERESNNALTIRSMSILTNGDDDTPEPIFAEGELIYA